MLSLNTIFHRKPEEPATVAISAALSDIGMVRKENQDAFLCANELQVWCVADGMGGGQGGALASRWACEEMEAAFTTGRTTPDDLGRIVCALSSRILDYAKTHHYKSMGTTIAMMWMPNVGRINILHVGDSRIYRVRNGVLKQLTHDHTVSNTLAKLPQSTFEKNALKSRRNPLSHILTRAIGPTRLVQCETIIGLEALARDRYLICSDGVHDLIENDELRRLIAKGRNPQTILDRIAKLCRKRGAHDNFTAIAIELKN